MKIVDRLGVASAFALLVSTVPSSAFADNYVLNGTSVHFIVYDNNQQVCSLAPGQDCWWPAPAGQHSINITRDDNRAISKTVSPRDGEDYGEMLMDTICPQDFGVSEPGVPACN